MLFVVMVLKPEGLDGGFDRGGGSCGGEGKGGVGVESRYRGSDGGWRLGRVGIVMQTIGVLVTWRTLAVVACRTW